MTTVLFIIKTVLLAFISALLLTHFSLLMSFGIVILIVIISSIEATITYIKINKETELKGENK